MAQNLVPKILPLCLNLRQWVVSKIVQMVGIVKMFSKFETVCAV